jgi:hypothetical protein
VLEPAHFVMERRMLLGIKERAETLSEQAVLASVKLRGVPTSDRSE